MELLESYTHSFVIKIWLEETAEEAAQAKWRGQIIHVLSGKLRYFEDLDDITGFMMPYLYEIGAKPTVGWRVKQWLRQRTAYGR